MQFMSDDQLAKKIRSEGRTLANNEEAAMRKERNKFNFLMKVTVAILSILILGTAAIIFLCA